MDPRRWISPQAQQFLELATRSSVELRSWITKLLLPLRTVSSRALVKAKQARFTTWLIISLLPAVPAGFTIKYLNQISAATFATNLVAMVALGALLTLFTDELIARKGGQQALLIIVTEGFVEASPPKISDLLLI